MNQTPDMSPQIAGNCVTTRPPVRRWLVVGMLCLHALLLGWSGYRNSWTWDEVSFLPAGISHWKFGNFELFDVNPPLVRMVAAVPVLFAAPQLDWSEYTEDVSKRPERPIGQKFVRNNGRRSLWLLTQARWACIPFSLIGATVCFHWSRRLYGNAAGYLCLTLWVFSPTIIAHGQLITADVGGASLGILGHYLFWQWLHKATWRNTLLFGVVLGIMQLTKTTWILLFAIWPAAWLLWRLCTQEGRRRNWLRHESGQLLIAMTLAVYVLNLGYGFEGTGKRLGDFEFISSAIGGPLPPDKRSLAAEEPPFGGVPRNRFTNTLLGELPVPFPQNYVQGIDRQKSHFEAETWSYLAGEWRNRGWVYYYLYAAVMKVPLGTWVIAVVAFVWFVAQSASRAALRDEVFLLSMLVTFLTFVSMQTGFNRHLRYIMPCVPFALILISRAGQSIAQRQYRFAVPVVVGLAWMIGSSLSTFPHHIAYFNELAGGPENGYRHLLSSNTDWGQGLTFLDEWVENNPQAEPIGLAWHTRVVDPDIMGFEHRPVPDVPTPGWYALSVNQLAGRSGRYKYFLETQPVASAGFSIPIYHLRKSDANRLRREMGYPPVPAEDLLKRLSDILPYEGRSVRIVEWNAVQNMLVSAGGNGAIQIHDPIDLSVRNELFRHTGEVRSAAFSPGGKQLVAAYSDGSVYLWTDLTQPPVSFFTSVGLISRVQFTASGDRIIIGGEDGVIEVRSATATASLETTLHLEKPVLAMDCSPDGSLLATGTGHWRSNKSGDVKFWKLSTGRLVRTLAESDGVAKVVAFSNDGTQVVGRGSNELLRIWNVPSGRCTTRLVNSKGIGTAFFACDDQLIVAADFDGYVKVWDAESGEMLLMQRCHDGRVFSGSMVQRGNNSLLVTSGADGSLTLWDASQLPGTGGHHAHAIEVRSSTGGNLAGPAGRQSGP